VLHTYVHDPLVASYGAEAAAALGFAPEVVFKTLMVEADGRLAVGVVPVSGNLDLKAFAAVLGAKKAAMADPAAAQRRTGYVLGGISPLGQRQPSPTVIDASALGLRTMLVSGGAGFRRQARPGYRTGPGGSHPVDLCGNRRHWHEPPLTPAGAKLP
jgi:Cys-tRNA(Pro)/Cys-tRNA(Cys) deacylase